MSEGTILGLFTGSILLVGGTGIIAYAYETFDAKRLRGNYERNQANYQLKLFDYDREGNFVYPQS